MPERTSARLLQPCGVGNPQFPRPRSRHHLQAREVYRTCRRTAGIEFSLSRAVGIAVLYPEPLRGDEPLLIFTVDLLANCLVDRIQCLLRYFSRFCEATRKLDGRNGMRTRR